MSEKFQIFLSLLQIFSFSFACKVIVDTYSFPNSDIVLKFEEKTNGLEYFFTRGGNILQRVSLDVKFKKAQILRTKKGVTLTGKNNEKLHFELIEDNPNFSMMHITRNLTKDDISTDCFDLNIGSVSWYGGPENFYQYWPIEKASFANYAYVPKEKGNCAIAERYWLNSNGLFVYIEDDTPLFINQNTEEYPNKLCFSGNKILPYNVRSDTYTFNYRIGIGSNSRTAHLRAVQSVLGKPVAAPDEKMVRYPIWSTWALYKTEINESVVREFAENIVEYEFENSQLEIDDDWEDCYGALTFRKSKFPDIKNLTDELKEMGFRITLWIHPFINKNCAEWYNEAKDKNYFVLDHQGNPDTQWWNSKENEAAYIDFTNTEAAKWFNDRLKLLQDMAGIDSFKFDAGESSWTPSVSCVQEYVIQIKDLPFFAAVKIRLLGT